SCKGRLFCARAIPDPSETKLLTRPHPSVDRHQKRRQVVRPAFGQRRLETVFFFTEKPNLPVVFGPALDSCCWVGGQLFIVHGDAENETKCGLIPVPRCRGPHALISLSK